MRTRLTALIAAALAVLTLAAAPHPAAAADPAREAGKAAPAHHFVCAMESGRARSVTLAANGAPCAFSDERGVMRHGACIIRNPKRSRFTLNRHTNVLRYRDSRYGITRVGICREGKRCTIYGPFCLKF